MAVDFGEIYKEKISTKILGEKLKTVLMRELMIEIIQLSSN